MRTSDHSIVDTSEFLLAALEQASEAIVIVDSNFRIRHFNAAAKSIWGVQRTDVLGCDARGIGFNELHHGAVSEIRIPRRDGSRVRARCRCRLSRSRAGPAHGLRSRHHHGGRTAREDGAAPSVADRTNRAVVVTDRDLRIVYVNAAFTALFGYSAGGSEGPAGERTARGPPYRPQDAGKVAALDRRGKRRRGGNPRLRQERRRDLGIGQRQGVPRRARAGQADVRPADRYQRDQAVAVAAAIDHERAGR